jgi:uncharacterized membrane protein YgcG
MCLSLSSITIVEHATGSVVFKAVGEEKERGRDKERGGGLDLSFFLGFLFVIFLAAPVLYQLQQWRSSLPRLPTAAHVKPLFPDMNLQDPPRTHIPSPSQPGCWWDDAAESPVNGGWQVCPASGILEMNTSPEVRSCRRLSLTQWNALSSEDILNLQEPVLITDAVSQWPCMQNWKRKVMEEMFGEVSFNISGQIPVRKQRKKGQEVTQVPLKAYLHELRQNASLDVPVIFDRSGSLTPRMLQDLRRPTNPPEMAKKEAWTHMTLSLGSHGSGVTWHMHPRTWNALFFGYKRWFFMSHSVMQDPAFRVKFQGTTKAKSTDQLLPMPKWVKQVYTQNFTHSAMVTHGWDCVQGPGDLMYFQDWLWHGTWNQGEVLSVVSELCGNTDHANQVDQAMCRELLQVMRKTNQQTREFDERRSKERQAALGLQWVETGNIEPDGGRRLQNSKLADALSRQNEFTTEEWKEFGISDLQDSDFIQAGDAYFKPAGDETEGKCPSSSPTNPNLELPEYRGVKVPPWFDTATSRKLENMALMPTDVVLASWPRSGTHWVYKALHLLSRDGARAMDMQLVDTLPLAAHHLFPTEEKQMRPGAKLGDKTNTFESFLERQALDGDYRIFTTHAPAAWLPFPGQGQGKLVYVARDPRDVAVSHYHFRGTSRGWNDALEGFLAPAENSPKTFGAWFEHVAGFEAMVSALGQDRALIIEYEEMHKDLPAQLWRLARLLGPAAEARLAANMEDICSQLQFSAMKQSKHMRHVPVSRVSKLLRAGKTGGWRDQFSEEDANRMAAAVKERLPTWMSRVGVASWRLDLEIHHVPDKFPGEGGGGGGKGGGGGGGTGGGTGGGGGGGTGGGRKH